MLNISKQIYAGWDNTSIFAHLPESEIIPLGDSVQEKKKLEKFVIKHNILKEYDNIPLPGFTLYDVGKKKWSSADSTWIVIDPRGFTVRITQENMISILQVTGITEGLIQQRCVWAREDSQSTMMLIPISSPDYVEAVDNTGLLEDKIDISEVQIGDTVMLQNKLTGTYLGVQSLYCTMDNANFKSNFKVQSSMRRQVVEVKPGKFYHHSDAKILKVMAKTFTPLTRVEACKYLNDSIKNDPATYFSSWDRMTGHYYGSHGRVKLASIHAVPKVKISLEEIELVEAVSLLQVCKMHTDSGCLVGEDRKGTQYTVDFPWWGSTLGVVPADEFYINEIVSVEEDHIVHVPNKIQYYNVSTIVQKTSYKLDFFTKFYKIVKSVKSDTYI
jgi:hypothetical protein